MFLNRVKLWFYDPRFYIIREFMHFFLGPSQTPITITLKFNGVYICITSHFSWIFTPFSIPGNEHLLILRFAVKFSEFLILGNRPPFLSAVTNDSVWKYILSVWWCMATSPQSSANEQIFPLPQFKQLACTMPALDLMRPSIIVYQWVYFVSHSSYKCAKERLLQHRNHYVFIYKIFKKMHPG